MNASEKEFLRLHWQKPGKLKTLLATLPMTPYANDATTNSQLKLVVFMTGISYEPAEMAQVYYMLEEDGVLVRDGEPTEPAAYLRCTHIPKGSCAACAYEIGKRGMAAAVRYRLAKPLADF